MSEQYQIFVLLPDGISGEKAIYHTHLILEQMGETLDKDSILILNKLSNESPSPKYITDADNALVTLALWANFRRLALTLCQNS